jgi:hypothetical protein
MHGEPAEVAAANLGLAGMDSGTNLKADFRHPIHEGQGTAGCGDGALERGEESIARGGDLAAPETDQFTPGQGVMSVEQVSPPSVADVSPAPGRVINGPDIKEEKCRI